jgi:general secretion pathway protein H
MPVPFAFRAKERGLTLIEVVVVLSILALVVGIVVTALSQTPSAHLRRSTTLIASAIKVAYTRATATSKDLRIVMDLDSQKVWLEESDAPMLTQAKAKSSAGGADPVTQAEREAIAEGDKILKGPPIPKPHFHPIDSTGFGDADSVKGKRSLPSGIKFRSVQTTHDENPRTSGRAYLYFWPGGRTERASIQVNIDEKGDTLDRAMTLLVSPLTGRVAIKGGATDLVVPTDDNQASEREDTGF